MYDSHARAPGRRGHLLLPDRLQRAVPAAAAPRTSRGSTRASCAACTATRRRRPTQGRLRRRRRGRSCSPPGVAMPWALKAQQLLAEDWGVAADVWSVTSWTELRRDALACESHNMLHPGEEPRVPYVTPRWPARQARWSPSPTGCARCPTRSPAGCPAASYTSLGTDGFGFSDTRPAARRFFHVDAESIVLAVLAAARQVRRGGPVAARPGDRQVQAGPAGVAGPRLGRARTAGGRPRRGRAAANRACARGTLVVMQSKDAGQAGRRSGGSRRGTDARARAPGDGGADRAVDGRRSAPPRSRRWTSGCPGSGR